MTAILTTAGSAHISEREQGDIVTNSFDGLVLGAGNDDPGISDTVASLTQRLDLVMRLASGYPKKGDTDSRNTGKGANTWTWLFMREGGEPFVASNAAVATYSGGALLESGPLLVHAKQTLAQRHDERLLVWVNAELGETPTIVTATETALENRVQRISGFTARVRAMGSDKRASVVDDRTIRSQIAPGEAVWTAAELVRVDGYHVVPEDVERATVTLQRLDGATGDYVEVRRALALPCHLTVSATLQRNDGRWGRSGGYNFSHTWEPPRGLDEATYRLQYDVQLKGTSFRFWHVLEVR